MWASYFCVPCEENSHFLKGTPKIFYSQLRYVFRNVIFAISTLPLFVFDSACGDELPLR